MEKKSVNLLQNRFLLVVNKLGLWLLWDKSWIYFQKNTGFKMHWTNYNSFTTFGVNPWLILAHPYIKD